MERLARALERTTPGRVLRSDTPAELPPLDEPETDRLTRLICWTSTNGRSELLRELTPDERSALEARRDALEACLKPYDLVDLDQVNADLSAMFSGFRSMRQAGLSIDDTLEGTRNALRKYPAWAIAQVCGKVSRGEASSTIRTGRQAMLSCVTWRETSSRRVH